MNIALLREAARLLLEHDWTAHEKNKEIPGWDYERVWEWEEDCGTHCCAAGLLLAKGLGGVKAEMGKHNLHHFSVAGEKFAISEYTPSASSLWTNGLAQLFDISPRMAETIFTALHWWKVPVEGDAFPRMTAIRPHDVAAALLEVAETGQLVGVAGSRREGAVIYANG